MNLEIIDHFMVTLAWGHPQFLLAIPPTHMSKLLLYIVESLINNIKYTPSLTYTLFLLPFANEDMF